MYIFSSEPQYNNKDSLIATAINGEVYTENNRLHIKTSTMHYIYKFNDSLLGWYARNPKTLNDIYLGKGASPTATFKNLDIKDMEYWLAIIQPEEEPIDND